MGATASLPLQAPLLETNIPGVPNERLPVLDRIGSRGFDLQGVLEFLCLLLDRDRALADIDGLKETFRHWAALQEHEIPNFDWFDAESSTTFDVAYKAVVPLSKRVQSAYAPIMMKGRRIYPKAILSHSWRNTFTHSIAACIADALDEKYYFHIAARLYGYDDVCSILSELRDARVLHYTYWMCVFSINQHAIACHEHGCDCAMVKCTDDKDPNCEIGHFHVMMRFLQSRHADFYQVVAFDKSGTVLDRVWVVAEVAEVHRSGLRQKMIFHVPLAIAGKEIVEKMRCLDVRDASATIESDKDMILDQIKDKDKYNRRVRARFLFCSQPDFLAASNLNSYRIISYTCCVLGFTCVACGLCTASMDNTLIKILGNMFLMTIGVACAFCYFFMAASVQFFIIPAVAPFEFMFSSSYWEVSPEKVLFELEKYDTIRMHLSENHHFLDASQRNFSIDIADVIIDGACCKMRESMWGNIYDIYCSLTSHQGVVMVFYVVGPSYICVCGFVLWWTNSSYITIPLQVMLASTTIPIAHYIYLGGWRPIYRFIVMGVQSLRADGSGAILYLSVLLVYVLGCLYYAWKAVAYFQMWFRGQEY